MNRAHLRGCDLPERRREPELEHFYTVAHGRTNPRQPQLPGVPLILGRMASRSSAFDSENEWGYPIEGAKSRQARI